jgi:COMPASS component SWD3
VVRLWDVRSGNCVLSLEAHSRRICAVAFNADGKRFVTSSFDGLCRVWDTLTGQCCTTIVSPSMGSRGVPAVSAARFSPNGDYLLLSTLDSAVRLWDVDAGKCVKTYRGHVNKGYCAFSTFFAMDGIGGHGEQHASIVSGSECGKVYVWGLQSRELDDSLAGHNDMVLAVDTHPSLPVIASGSCGKDPTVRLWRRKE